ncbi:MAG: 50S ribosomal protein L18 [Candidatus Kaiserbacteria bacterium]|nr:50S ribosomal protein L18 [Candidatus Kaiserbacteria bacterium]
MKKTAQKVLGRIQRHRRIRSRVSGTPDKPRLAFFRSSKHLYAQIIDDTAGQTLAATSSLKSNKKGAIENAKQMGATIAEQAKQKKVKEVVFDRGGFMYTGSVKEFADAARAGGLEF